MVTMRRDVAVTKNVSAGADGLTAYDKFLMKKNARRGGDCDASSREENFFERMSFSPAKKAPKESVAEAKIAAPAESASEKSGYERYLLERLARKSPDERLLREEEFYESLLTASKPAGKVSDLPKTEKKKKEARPSRFSKIGRIILSVYVLAVLSTAFTLIAVNVFDSKPVKADAETNTELGERTIRPMTTETLEKEEESWFDSLCDTVKK